MNNVRDVDRVETTQEPSFAHNDQWNSYYQNAQFSSAANHFDHSIRKRSVSNKVFKLHQMNATQPEQRSLAIVFDGSESMKLHLQQLQRSVKVIFAKFAAQQQSSIYNYIFVPFQESG